MDHPVNNYWGFSCRVFLSIYHTQIDMIMMMCRENLILGGEILRVVKKLYKMTTIKRLSIQGIRSYSDKSEEVIEFFKPLTIIVGSNGSGKTTIIEALKFATTGVQPPLSDSGKNFVHDPKIVGSGLVKAGIKFSFVTATGEPFLSHRIFQVGAGYSVDGV